MRAAARQRDTAEAAPTPAQDDELPTLAGAKLWGIGVLLSLANFVAVLDLTITNVSVPTIAGGLGVSISQGAWIITSYAVAEAITAPLAGWLAARFGAARVFSAALCAFALASLLCGLSPSIEMLVAWRVLQGVCGAPLMPLSQTLLLRLFPDRLHPAAMGAWGVTTLAAPICGPILGGVLCDSFGWPSIFLINVPIAVGAGLIAWRVLAASRGHVAARAPFDGVGLVLLIVWVGLLQVMLDIGKDHDWFESRLIVALAVGSAISFWAFLFWELTAEHPIVDLRVLRHRGFTAGMAALGCALAGVFATNVLTPLWLQANLGYTATQAGLAMGAIGVLAVAASPVAAWLCTRTDPRAVAFMGVAWLMGALLLRSLANTDMTFWQVFGQLLLVGAAVPTFFLPLTMTSMAAVTPEETANASGLSSFVRTVTSAFATSIVMTRWEKSTSVFHADLVGRSPNLQLELDRLTGAGFTPGQARLVLDQIVQNQALVLATNRLSWEIAAFLALRLCLIWLIPRPARMLAPPPPH
jgi:DHA2 family multidrug resistance protein